MSQSKLATFGVLGFVACLLGQGCGAVRNANEVQLGSPKSNGSSSKEVANEIRPVQNSSEELGLSDSREAMTSGMYNVFIDGTPNPFKPKNFDVANSAFANVVFSKSGQKCSAMRIYENSGDGTFNIYLLTAAHCLYSVTPAGAPAGQIAEAHSFELTEYDPIQTTYKWGGKSVAHPRAFNMRWYWTPKKRSFTNLRPQQAGNSDVVRFLVESGVSFEDAEKRALPLCGKDIEPPTDLDLKRTQAPVRMALGWSDAGLFPAGNSIMFKGHPDPHVGRGGVLLTRMNGAYRNITNRGTRSYDQYGAGQDVADFVSRTQAIDPEFTYYTYTMTGGKGVEATDSGAPILYGIQESPEISKIPYFTSTQMSSFLWAANLDPERRIVRDIQCVSGVITREFWSKKFDALGPTGRGYPNVGWMLIMDPRALGESNTAIIQNVWRDMRWVNR